MSRPYCWRTLFLALRTTRSRFPSAAPCSVGDPRVRSESRRIASNEAARRQRLVTLCAGLLLLNMSNKCLSCCPESPRISLKNLTTSKCSSTKAFRFCASYRISVATPLHRSFPTFAVPRAVSLCLRPSTASLQIDISFLITDALDLSNHKNTHLRPA